MAEPFKFGPVPTAAEVGEAVCALLRLFNPRTYAQNSGDAFPSLEKDTIDKELASTELVKKASPTEFTLNKTARQLHQPKSVKCQGLVRVFDAFRLLVFNPFVQRLVVSLSTDKAVWDAIMKNEVVQEIQECFHAEPTKPRSFKGRNNEGGTILRWIMENTKAKLMEFFDRIIKLVNELFQSQEKVKTRSKYDDVVRSSFMISSMVFMVIVAARMR